MKYLVEFKTTISAESEQKLKQKIQKKLAQWSLDEGFKPSSIDITALPPKEEVKQ